MARVDGPGGHVADLFTRCYGRPAEVAWLGPGRVNMIGEHTDYNGGLVLPFAIGRFVAVAAAARGDGIVEMRTSQSPDDQVTVRVDALRPGSVTGWAAYPAGVAWALREAGVEVRGASLVIDSDLPQGAGLASSAALECAVAACLADLAARRVPGRELAAIARRAENDFVGVPCGIMDQSAVMLCETGNALLLDCRSGESEPVPIDPVGMRFLVVDTGVRHELTGGEYAARLRECEAAASLLGVPSLREADDLGALADLGTPADLGSLARLGSLADPVLARRARHVVTENRRVVAAVDLLRAGRLADCGPLLTESHRSLRDDFEVSWPQADVAVQAAIRAGALGARMTGGGFGGCVLALVPAASSEAIMSAVGAALATRGRAATAFIEAVPAAGARRILGHPG
jgi:galactokinase